MKKYPVNVSRGEPGPAAQSGSSRHNFWTLVVVPLVLFVAGVVGITILLNQTPSAPPTLLKPGGQNALTFREPEFSWDPARPGYVGEYEKKEGHHNYWFDNRSDEPVEISLRNKSCSCTQVELCLLPPEQARALQRAEEFQKQLQAQADFPGPPGQAGLVDLISLAAAGNDGYGGLAGRSLPWQALEPPDPGQAAKGIAVPARSSGLVRLTWDGSRQVVDKKVRLKVDLQTGPRALASLEPLVVFVDPVKVYPKFLEVSDWDANGVARLELRCWSATRADFPLEAKVRGKDSCVATETVPLTGTECQQLEQDLAQGGEALTRVLSGYRITVTVAQQKGDCQLEQGLFQRWINLDSAADPLLPAVRVGGVVRGAVTVESGRGVIDVGNIRRTENGRGWVDISVPPDMQILFNKIEKIPEVLQVTWSPLDPVGDLKRWRLKVVVPANKLSKLPDDSAIVLPTLQGKQARRLRIPIEGNIFQ